MELKREDMQELQEILMVASWDVQMAIGRSHDMEEVQALREVNKKIGKWSKRFLEAIKESQQEGQQGG